jgi:hypothetical protein
MAAPYTRAAPLRGTPYVEQACGQALLGEYGQCRLQGDLRAGARNSPERTRVGPSPWQGQLKSDVSAA